jgi:hypothetical protein
MEFDFLSLFPSDLGNQTKVGNQIQTLALLSFSQSSNLIKYQTCFSIQYLEIDIKTKSYFD